MEVEGREEPRRFCGDQEEWLVWAGPAENLHWDC